MDPKAWVEVQAPTVEEAIILGLTRLGITRDEAAIKIVDEGSQGFLGLGSREARVKVRRLEQKPSAAEPVKPKVPEKEPAPAASKPATSKEEEPEVKAVPAKKAEVKKPAPEAPRPSAKKPVEEEPAEKKPAKLKKKARKPASKPEPEGTERSSDDPRKQIEAVVLDVGSHLFGALDVQPKLTWREEDRRPALWLSLEGDDAESLIGRHGKTLNAAQFLMRVLVRNQIDGNFNLILDVDGYRWRRYHNVKSLARKMAKKAVSTGQPVRLRPMPARERRIVHMTLRDDGRVRTKSYGSGRGRAVTVFPVNSDSH